MIDRQSYERMNTFWIPEIQKNIGKRVPIVLVATHTDLRHDKYIQRCVQVVTTSEGKQLAELIGANGFFEISKSNINQLNAIFECAVTAVISNKNTLLTIFKKIFCTTCINKNE